MKSSWRLKRNEARKSVTLQLEAIEQRLARLTDAFVDGMLDRDAYAERRQALLLQRQQLQEAAAITELDADHMAANIRKFFEQAKSLQSSYILADTEKKRSFLESTTSNRTVDGNAGIALVSPYSALKIALPSLPLTHIETDLELRYRNS